MANHAGGRPSDPVWEHFEKTKYRSGCQGTCNYCHEVMMGKVDTMLNHLGRGCARVSPEIQEWAKAEKKRKRGEESPAVAVKSEPAGDAAKLSQKAFIVTKEAHLSAQQHYQIDMQLVKFIASANVPLSVVENVEFIKFCRMLRGSYNVPNR